MDNIEIDNFYGVLYEFDSHVRAMVELIGEAEKKSMPLKEQNLLNHYDMLLRELTKAYDAIDQNLAQQIQNSLQTVHN